MKYIKIFEEFLPNNIKDDIKDIFLELEDEGFEIHITTKYKSDNKYLVRKPNRTDIEIFKASPAGSTYCFKFSEVSESILRLLDYLDDKYQILLKVNGINFSTESFDINEILEKVKDQERLIVITISIFRK